MKIEISPTVTARSLAFSWHQKMAGTDANEGLRRPTLH